jgi:type II secretory pathway pseudopilin PulG
MKLRATNLSPAALAARCRAAFSLIEVLVVTGLLSVIIIGLVLMFSQTQRAYKLGTTQVDVLEGGRMVTDILTRDLQQLTPAQLPVTNFFLRMRNYAPLVQTLSGSTAQRTNLLQDLLFLTKENQKWTAVGYFVRTNDNFNNMDFPYAASGSLYRFETNYTEAFFKQYPYQFWNDFLTASFDARRASRILEGVVHFKVRGFDPAGFWISGDRGSNIYTNSSTGTDALYPFGETGNLHFLDNAVPATVEVELGVLESKEIERARSITDATARANYLKQQAGKVHVFRWRVAIRNFDPAAYQ